MKKCPICKTRKAKRYCAALSDTICSYCCGVNRGVNIDCFEECAYLREGAKHQMVKEIDRRIREAFPNESSDVFQNQNAVAFAHPLELFFIENFRGGNTVNDNDIYRSLSFIYASRNGLIPHYEPQSECEKMINQKFNELDVEFDELDSKIKDLVILRILLSIKRSSGGILGDRNYLEFIYSQFNPDGKWSDQFREK